MFFYVLNKQGWIYDGSKYIFNFKHSQEIDYKSLTQEEKELIDKVEDDAREFVAPMWLDSDKANFYAQFEKLTVEESNESLVMKLYVVSGNSGQLVDGANLVFSQATIY